MSSTGSTANTGTPATSTERCGHVGRPTAVAMTPKPPVTEGQHHYHPPSGLRAGLGPELGPELGPCPVLGLSTASGRPPSRWFRTVMKNGLEGDRMKATRAPGVADLCGADSRMAPYAMAWQGVAISGERRCSNGRRNGR
jgi:hypothetical protein